MKPAELQTRDGEPIGSLFSVEVTEGDVPRIISRGDEFFAFWMNTPEKVIYKHSIPYRVQGAV